MPQRRYRSRYEDCQNQTGHPPYGLQRSRFVLRKQNIPNTQDDFLTRSSGRSESVSPRTEIEGRIDALHCVEHVGCPELVARSGHIEKGEFVGGALLSERNEVGSGDQWPLGVEADPDVGEGLS